MPRTAIQRLVWLPRKCKSKPTHTSSIDCSDSATHSFFGFPWPNYAQTEPTEPLSKPLPLVASDALSSPASFRQFVSHLSTGSIGPPTCQDDNNDNGSAYIPPLQRLPPVALEDSAVDAAAGGQLNVLSGPKSMFELKSSVACHNQRLQPASSPAPRSDPQAWQQFPAWSVGSLQDVAVSNALGSNGSSTVSIGLKMFPMLSPYTLASTRVPKQQLSAQQDCSVSVRPGRHGQNGGAPPAAICTPENITAHAVPSKGSSIIEHGTILKQGLQQGVAEAPVQAAYPHVPRSRPCGDPQVCGKDSAAANAMPGTAREARGDSTAATGTPPALGSLQGGGCQSTSCRFGRINPNQDACNCHAVVSPRGRIPQSSMALERSTELCEQAEATSLQGRMGMPRCPSDQTVGSPQSMNLPEQPASGEATPIWEGSMSWHLSSMIPVTVEQNEQPLAWGARLLAMLVDSRHRNQPFSGRYQLTGEHVGGRITLVAFARNYNRGGFEFAIKFFKNPHDFDVESQLYQRRPVRCLLPQIFCSSEGGSHSDLPDNPDLMLPPPCIVVERGLSLRRWMEQSFAYEAVLDLFIAVARLLERVHSAGIVHFDIRPSNIILMQHTKVWKLTGFAHCAQIGV
jgi:hypothetical protein